MNNEYKTMAQCNLYQINRVWERYGIENTYNNQIELSIGLVSFSIIERLLIKIGAFLPLFGKCAK